MDNTKLWYAAGGIIVGALLVWAAVPGSGRLQNSSMHYERGGMDAHFIEQMIPHHNDAIAMANIALQKAEHQEIKTLAAAIIQAQNSENEKMRAWYKDWYSKNVADTGSTGHMGMGSGMMHGGMMGDATDIRNLETAKPFDKEFIEQMIPHHQMAVMMAEMVRNSSERQEIRQLATDIISAQNTEIEKMRGWYRDWYGS